MSIEITLLVAYLIIERVLRIKFQKPKATNVFIVTQGKACECDQGTATVFNQDQFNLAEILKGLN